MGDTYDLTLFLDIHPGGAQVLDIARERFGDCTDVFLAHHVDVEKALQVLRPFRVAQPTLGLESSLCPFHTALRREIHQALRGKTGPSRLCLRAFYATAAAWVCGWITMYQTGSHAMAAIMGVVCTWLGAFGHNFVHQPKYFAHARFALDAIGLSASVWRREHVLQHHIYTNTERDNHWEGTEPFLVVDPGKPRTFLQKRVFPAFAPVVMCFGVFGNYASRVAAIARGEEVISSGEVVLPLQVMLLCGKHGLVGGASLILTQTAVTGAWYFSIALTNHNAASCRIGEQLREETSWAKRQVLSCADWHTSASFWTSVFLWLGLNRHTVHHVFPKLDFSRHAAAQSVLEKVCREHDVEYKNDAPFWQLYLQSLRAFRGRGSPGKKNTNRRNKT